MIKKYLAMIQPLRKQENPVVQNGIYLDLGRPAEMKKRIISAVKWSFFGCPSVKLFTMYGKPSNKIVITGNLPKIFDKSLSPHGSTKKCNYTAHLGMEQ